MRKRNVVIAILLIAIFAVFALGSSDAGTDDQGNGNADGTQGNLGEYNVEILSCRIAQDYEGRPVVIVKYNFKNVADDDATSFMMSVTDKAYQNGMELETCYSVDDSANYDSGKQSTDIKKGASIEVEVAYKLLDTTADVEIEVEESFSFVDKCVKKHSCWRMLRFLSKAIWASILWKSLAAG